LKNLKQRMRMRGQRPLLALKQTQQYNLLVSTSTGFPS